jgi:hypothetical protein
MNKHLQSVREFRETYALPQETYGRHGHLSDMDITMRQAWLMEAGSEVLRALKKAEMAEILVRLTGLAYCALSAIAMQGGDVVESPVSWRHDGSVLSVMRLLSERINNCTSGRSEDYSALYCACAHLTSSFLNADFDKALQMFHAGRMDSGRRLGVNAGQDVNWDRYPTPDLSECLYE